MPPAPYSQHSTWSFTAIASAFFGAMFVVFVLVLLFVLLLGAVARLRVTSKSAEEVGAESYLNPALDRHVTAQPHWN